MLILQLGFVYWPVMHEVFDTPLTLPQLVAAALVATVSIVGVSKALRSRALTGGDE